MFKTVKELIEGAGANYHQVFADLKHLDEVGFWSGGKAPAWASALAQAWMCHTGSSAITSNGYKYCAEEMSSELSQLKGSNHEAP